MIDLVFFGTDLFAVKVLSELKKLGLAPRMIITAPDTPAGRHLTLTPPPVKIWAQQNNISFLQPVKLSDPDFIHQLKATSYQLCLVASYGKILPADLLAQWPNKFLNIHPSLLPRYRGPSPLQTAIADNDAETGVTIMVVDEAMDHGPIIATQTVAINQKWFEKLRDETAQVGAELLVKILPDWLAGKLKSEAQNHQEATYTKKITKPDGEINLADDPVKNFAKIRAYTPAPGAYFFTTKHGKQTRLIIKKAHLSESNELIIDRVVPEGKRETDYRAWLNS
jgi:methionyl-tRNA formyltransferase